MIQYKTAGGLQTTFFREDISNLEPGDLFPGPFGLWYEIILLMPARDLGDGRIVRPLILKGPIHEHATNETRYGIEPYPKETR